MLTVLIPNEAESWNSLRSRLNKTEGEVIVILPSDEKHLPPHDEEGFQKFFDACEAISLRLTIATLDSTFLSVARLRGLSVIDRISDLKIELEGHPSASTALQRFSPHIWRQQLRSHLQSMGLLSLPKLRVWILILVSVSLLFFVLFKLLPSAEVKVWPHGDTISQTANIFLVQSGSTLELPPRVKVLDLIPLNITVDKKITFDRISKNFIGESARVPMTVINKSDETYSLRKGSRVANQAGMVFRLQDQAIVPAGDELTVRAVADDLDLYGEIIGERGNVPSGLKWTFPGLSREEESLVYAENRGAAVGGTTAYSTVLREGDLDLAKKQLEQELLTLANQMIDEELELENSTNKNRKIERLYYDIFTSATYSGFVLPTKHVGEEILSIPIEGEITFTALAYDKSLALEMLFDDLVLHVGEGKKLVEDSVSVERLIHHVIDYADDTSWIKLTVDLDGRQQFILDPLTPYGAHFAMKMRDKVAGKRKDEAERIVKNMMEVENAEVKLWPPWTRKLPEIPSHISVTPVIE